MLNQTTIEKLKDLHLHSLATASEAQQKSADALTMGFDERLDLLVDAEWLAKENSRVERNLREAKLRISNASLEDVDFASKRELDKPQAPSPVTQSVCARFRAASFAARNR